MRRVLIIGSGKGSWQMRGLQLGEALEARVTPRPNLEDWARADVIVLVKRAIEEWGPTARATGKPLVWDALDFWEQPEQNQAPQAVLRAEASALVRQYGIRVIVAATEAMAITLGGVYLPHQSRLGLRPTPSRPDPQIVAYDGASRYLGTWRSALEVACDDRGLRFVVNPPDLSTADLLVAFRDGPWDGWACRTWKSGVKYVNAIAAGRPILTQPCAAFEEIAPTGIAIADRAELPAALNACLKPSMRLTAYEDGCRRAPQYTVSAIAARYRAILEAA